MAEFEKCLAMTDADLPLVGSLYAWIGEGGELVVEYSVRHDRRAERDFTKRAVVDGEDAEAMADRLSVARNQLPEALFEACAVAYDTTLDEVERVFQEALNVILDAGVQYRMRDIK